MKRIFLWFYRLPLPEAAILVILATAVFLYLRAHWGHRFCWQPGNALLLLVWIAVILYGTLGQRTEGGTQSSPILTPFYSYYTALNGGSKELYRTNFMNVVLFYPAGLLGFEILPKQRPKWQKVLLIFIGFMLISIGIEYCQYRFGLGLAEADDLIHNTLGAALGALACCAPSPMDLLKQFRKK